MSIRIMATIWGAGPANGPERFVLLCLADYANDSGDCWPSMDRIAEKCCISDRGARGIVRRLEAGGWLEIDLGGGRYGCNKYHINPEPRSPLNGQKPGTTFPPKRSETRNHVPPGTTFPPERERQKPGTRVSETRNPVPPNHQEPPRTIINTPISPLAEKLDDFEKFWGSCPRKTGKGAARKAYAKAVKKADRETILSKMAEYARTREGQDKKYTVHPSRWLNEERWCDEYEGGENFHDKIEGMLNGISGQNGKNNISAERLSAPIRASLPPARG